MVTRSDAAEVAVAHVRDLTNQAAEFGLYPEGNE